MGARRFDHDEAVRRFQNGERIVDLARSYGVVPNSIRPALLRAIPELRSKPRLSLVDRFWAKVEKHDSDCACCGGCWHWRGSRNRLGYGNYTENRKPVQAHRFAWITLVGAIPEGIELHHRCRRPECVNPEHLEALTHADHMRLHKAERTHCGSGRELTPENTILRRGRRECRKCKAAYQKAYHLRHATALRERQHIRRARRREAA